MNFFCHSFSPLSILDLKLNFSFVCPLPVRMTDNFLSNMNVQSEILMFQFLFLFIANAMDLLDSPPQFLAFVSTLLMMLMTTHQSLELTTNDNVNEERRSQLDRLCHMPKFASLDAQTVH